jgi:peptidyl-prolyl cis-trans isomerase SurA
MRHRQLLAAALLAFAGAVSAQVIELNRVVAVVNDDVVTAQELEARTQVVLQQIAKANTPAPPRDVLTRQVLERLILERIQLRLAADAGLRVEDEAVNQVVANIAAENKLTPEQFRGVLARDGVDYAEFREDIRKEILISRLRARQVNNRVNVTPQEIDSYLASTAARTASQNEYRLAHILIAVPEAPNPEQIRVAREEAEQVLAKLRIGADFGQLAIAHSDGQQALEGGDLGWRRGGQLPTLFTDAVLSMREGEISDLIRSPSGFHIIKLVGVRGEEKRVIQQVHARHILIRPNEITTDAEARARLERLRERIISGDDFAQLARVHSDDMGSGANGGDLGWASPGQMVPEFEEMMFKTPIGQISQPFRSQFGWHIVQPLARRDHDSTEEYRRTRAAEALRQRKLEEETENWLRQIRDEAYVEYRLEG